jgi:hypothetical protein
MAEMQQSDAPLLQASPADIHSGFFKWEVRVMWSNVGLNRSNRI